MEKTKFWEFEGKLYPSLFEAQFAKIKKNEDCYCRHNNYTSFYHICSNDINEVEITSTTKDKKYKKFLGEKLVEYNEKKNTTTHDLVEINNAIYQIENEISLI